MANQTHEKLIASFYEAFQKRDYATMQQCYADDIVFNDEVFVNLKGKQAKAMWHMLLSGNGPLDIQFDNVQANDETGSCNWIARYNFSKSNRPVINKIQANFVFKDGKILKHTDHFNFWKWSSMALGTSGKLLGWSMFLKNKIREITKKSLSAFIEKNPQYL